MTLRAFAVLVAMLTACGAAMALPPPWTLEEAKAKADLVLIVKTTKSRELKPKAGVNTAIGLRPIRTLKGTVPENKDELLLAFHRKPKARGKIVQRRIIGGTGHPKPADGEVALVFLRRQGKEKHFRVVCGSYGYVSLDATKKDELAAIEKRIAMYVKWCDKVKDEKLRKAMKGYYKAALEHVRKLAEKARSDG
jgi:hypothetical protein